MNQALSEEFAVGYDVALNRAIKGDFFAMRKQGGLLVILALLTTMTCVRAQRVAQPQERERVALRAARMLDVRRGQLVNEAVVLIEGDRITAAGSRLEIPPQTRIVDLGDVTLLPGLIDAHTHITYHFDETGHFGPTGDTSAAVTMRYAQENARRTLEAGITTIRNLGAGALVDIRLRDAIKRGEAVGPRMIVSGEPLVPDDLASAGDELQRLAYIRQFVRARINEGADVIKIFEGVDERGMPLFSRDEIRAAVEEAAKSGRKVAVHAHEAAAIRAAADAGCASVEHGTFLDDDAVRSLVKHSVALVPTLYLPTHYLEHKSQFTAFGSSTWAFFERLRARNMENMRRAKKAGVLIINGSDAVAGLHGQNARETIWLVKAGLAPAEAMRAATLDAARLLGLDEQLGEIKEGKLADLIAVPSDPLRDINSLEHIVFVMQGGKVIRNNTGQPR